MAINWTEAQVAELVAKVVSEIRSGSPAPTDNWNSTQYNGRKLIGVYATMEEAIAQVETEMSAAGSDYVKLQELTEKQTKLSAELEEKMDRWMYLTDLAERIAAQE